MNENPIIQVHLSSENAELFDVSLNQGDISFLMIELTESQINQILEDIKAQLFLLKESYSEEK